VSRSPAVNVQTFINEHPFSGFQWLIFTTRFVIVLLDGFDTAAIGFIAPLLITEWNISKPELAPVLSAALFGLAFGALLAGPLSDRLGTALRHRPWTRRTGRCECRSWPGDSYAVFGSEHIDDLSVRPTLNNSLVTSFEISPILIWLCAGEISRAILKRCEVAIALL
jgi:MFS transporter, AAHS family, 4-hydroxybenzoate transporter